MPAYHAICAEATHLFTIEHVGATKALLQEQLALRQISTLTEALDVLGIEIATPVREFVDQFPIGLQGALLGLVHGNFSRSEEPFQMAFAWEPSYDYRLTIHEAQATGISQGGITVIIGTRYPDDPRA